jgi:hypothetical protein
MFWPSRIQKELDFSTTVGKINQGGSWAAMPLYQPYYESENQEWGISLWNGT